MFSSIRTFGDSLFEPFAFLSLAALFALVFYYHKKKDLFALAGIIVFLLMLSWRLALKISTTRYFEGLLLPAILMVSFLLTKVKFLSRYLGIILLLMLILFMGKGFHVNYYSKNYIEGVRFAEQYLKSSPGKKYLCCSDNDAGRVRYLLSASKSVQLESFPLLLNRHDSLDKALRYIISLFPLHPGSRLILLRWKNDNPQQYFKKFHQGQIKLLKNLQVSKNAQMRLLIFEFTPACRDDKKQQLFSYEFEPRSAWKKPMPYAVEFAKANIPFYKQEHIYPWELGFHFLKNKRNDHFQASIVTDPASILQGKGSLRIQTQGGLYLLSQLIPAQNLKLCYKLKALTNCGIIKTHIFCYNSRKGWNGTQLFAQCRFEKDKEYHIKDIFFDRMLIPATISHIRIAIEFTQGTFLIDDIRAFATSE